MSVDSVVERTAVLLGVAALTGAATWVFDLGALAFSAAIVALALIFKHVNNRGHPRLRRHRRCLPGPDQQVLQRRLPEIRRPSRAGHGGGGGGHARALPQRQDPGHPQFTKIVVGATMGFFVLVVVNLVAGFFTDGGLGLREGPLGILVGVVAIGLASLNLVLDFDLVERGARQGLPERYGWFAAFAIMVTLVWLYIELLRLLAVLRGD